MKFFLDTANGEAIEKALSTGLINGITTNPTLLSKEGQDPTQLLKKICALMEPDDVSIEITQKEPLAVYEQAHALAALAPNVVVKIPCFMPYSPIIKKLVKEGIALNITLIFSLNQGVLMSKLGVKYISPFIGRLDDNDSDGIQLIKDLKKVAENYNFTTQILAASMRHTMHVHQALIAGADVITLPVHLFDSLLNHPLTKLGIQQFDTDWQKLGIKQFP